MRSIKASVQDTPPGFVSCLMAGLLTCGSPLPQTFPGYCPVVLIGVAHRLQLRGQSRNWRLLATPHRVPISSRRISVGENHRKYVTAAFRLRQAPRERAAPCRCSTTSERSGTHSKKFALSALRSFSAFKPDDIPTDAISCLLRADSSFMNANAMPNRQSLHLQVQLNGCPTLFRASSFVGGDDPHRCISCHCRL